MAIPTPDADPAAPKLQPFRGAKAGKLFRRVLRHSTADTRVSRENWCESEARLPPFRQDSVRQHRRDHVARARDRRECRDFLALRPDAAARAACRPAGRAGQSVGARPEAGLASCGQAGGCEDVFSYPMFRDLERLQTVFTRHCRPRAASASTLAYRGQTRSSEGMLVSGIVLPGSRPAAGARTPARSRRRPEYRRAFRDRAQSQLLDDTAWRESGGPQRHDRRQRPVADDRRRGAAGLQRNDARNGSAACSCRSRCAG